MEKSSKEKRKLRVLKVVTILCLFSIWAGGYFCRDALPVTMNEYRKSQNIPESTYHIMVAVGYACYFFGKIMFGCLTLIWPGKISLAITVLVSASCTFGMAIVQDKNQSLVLYWVLRWCQAAGWIGAVKIVGEWFPLKQQGRAMSVLSLSFLLGDSCVRMILSTLVYLDWRNLFKLCAAATAFFILPIIWPLKGSPRDWGLRSRWEDGDKEEERSIVSSRSLVPSTPLLNSTTVKQYNGAASVGRTKRQILTSRVFFLLCLLGFCLSSIREMFNQFSADYLQSIGAQESTSSLISALFPFMGVPSCIFAGYVKDKHPKKRGWIYPIFGCLLAGCLTVLGVFGANSVLLCTVIMGASGLLTLGPYTLLAGAFSLEIGGRENAPIVCGLVDATSYMGSVIIISIGGTGISYQTYWLIAAGVAGGLVLVGLLFVWTLSSTNVRQKTGETNVQEDMRNDYTRLGGGSPSITRSASETDETRAVLV